MASYYRETRSPPRPSIITTSAAVHRFGRSGFAKLGNQELSRNNAFNDVSARLIERHILLLYLHLRTRAGIAADPGGSGPYREGTEPAHLHGHPATALR